MELTAKSGVPVEPIVLTLHGRPGIRGRVIFEDGELVGWTQVRALRFTGTNVPGADRLRQQGKRASAHRNEYSFQDLKPGRYALGVEIGSRVVGLTQVEVVDSVVEQDIRLGAFDPAEFVLIHVFDPEGERINDARFRTSFKSGGGSSSGGGTAVRRKDGGYHVPHHDPSGIGAGPGDGGTYSVTITSKKYGAKKISYELGRQSEFTVRFTLPGTLVVTLDGYTEEAEGAFHLSLYR